jgi:uncharacterized damage-inducible protein DinB
MFIFKHLPSPFLALILTLPLHAQPANFLPLDDFVRDWRIQKDFTLAVAEKMPAADYNFKATPDERTFGEQMIHIAGALFQRFNEISSIAPVRSPLPKTITKEFALKWLNESFDYVIQVLPKLTDEQLSKAKFKVDFNGRPGPEINGRDLVMNIFVHVAHHRAQCEVYLRLKGITPPDYTF